LSVLEVREILVKIEKNRKCVAFGKKKINSSKNSFLFVFLWVEVACLRGPFQNPLGVWCLGGPMEKLLVSIKATVVVLNE
jgi:hypothetical protein